MKIFKNSDILNMMFDFFFVDGEKDILGERFDRNIKLK